MFLPTTRDELLDRDWYYYDCLVVTGDAYVDHPSFGAAVISRLLESAGFRVAVLAQPRSAEDFAELGKPRCGVFIGAGNLDSMVAHYTVNKKRRHDDSYSPGRRRGLRPDRATLVYTRWAREAFGGDTPLIIGGLEASLRRFAHYDYWKDTVMESFLIKSGADLLVYGMGESQTLEIAGRLRKKKPVSEMHDIPGTAYVTSDRFDAPPGAFEIAPYEKILTDKRSYAEAARAEYQEHDPIRGKALIQRHGERYLVVLPPAMPLDTKELDRVFELPYTRTYHPKYEAQGGVPAIEEVRFSVIHNRGCIGGCSFCALAFHQGRMITSRSHESIVREVQHMTTLPDFKGYIHDVGGPTANFRHPSCQKQLKDGMCKKRRCLTPKPCPNLDTDHSDYLELLRKLRKIPGVKRAFIRSGVRYDYLLAGDNDEFFRDMVKYHVSGQLKIAPEHCINEVLGYMGKPSIEVFEKFMKRYNELNRSIGREQYVVPYLMSSHPGSTLQSAKELNQYLRRNKLRVEQVQDFYPTPGTLSTAMYYTGLDPMTMEEVYVARDPGEKRRQRELLKIGG